MFRAFKYSAAYLLLIPLVNWLFVYAPLWDLPGGGQWTPFAILPGFALVVRDLAQREIGHKVMILLLIGTILSYFLSKPEIAIASGLAFLVSETVDWMVYTVTKKPLSYRIFYSSLFSVPIDTMLFLYGVNTVVPGVLTAGSVVASIASKMIAALIVAYLLRRREKKVEARLTMESSDPIAVE